MAEEGATVLKQVNPIVYSDVRKKSEGGAEEDAQPSSVGYSSATVNRSPKSDGRSDIIVLSDEESSTNSGSPGGRASAAPRESNSPTITNISQIQQLLEQEENKLQRLKQLRGIQGPIAASDEDQVEPTGRSTTASVRSATKSNIVVVPGNQSQKSASSASGGSGTGISSRLQHIVDSIAVDQAFRSTQKVSAAPSMTPLKQQTLGLINKSLAHLSSSRSKTCGAKEVITITDSPSPVTKNPPPLLPTPAISSSGKLQTQVSTVSSSTPDPTLPSLRPVDPDKEKAIMAAVENSKRYKDYLTKHLLAKRSFQKQIERKIAIAPYPKTFRQVWPVIPVFDPSFIRNYGLEAILQHFDRSLNSSAQDKANGNAKMKPICNQCGCDFASAWQIRKSNSKQLLLCEACDFANLKILQRSKLANQLRDLLTSVIKERDQFTSECEEARKQVVSIERQLILSMTQQQQHYPPPLFSEKKQMTGSGLGLSSTSSLSNHLFGASSSSSSSTGGQNVGATGATVLVNSSQAVIPSILPSLSNQAAVEGSKKRKEVGGEAGGGPPGKSLKLDQTLDKLSKALLEKKLDEQRKQSAGKTGGSEKDGELGSSGLDSRKNKRKGTPRHKRHLSSSSP